MTASTEVLQGTLDLLILKTLALEAMHGWGIAQRIQQVSREMLQIQQGSLYPALYRLERKGLIRAGGGASDSNRRAKFYSLTKKGRAQLEKELADWERLSSAVALILQRGERPGLRRAGFEMNESDGARRMRFLERWFRRGKWERELGDELRFHVE